MTAKELAATLCAGPCFAVLDAARDAHVHRATLSLGGRFMYLIDGVDEPILERCAPRIVELDARPSPALVDLLARGFGRSWGYFVRSAAPLLDLRDQLASLLDAQLASGDVVRFRVFDPRILRAYLPTCGAAELARVFGPIDEFLVEDAEAQRCELARLLRYARGPRGELICEAAGDARPSSPAPPRPTSAPGPLSLRAEQVAALSGGAQARFEAKLLAHLEREFPEQCRALGEAELRAVLDHGIARARGYQLLTELEQCKYFNLMFCFGRDFDREQRWARQILAGGRGPGLIDRLYGVALVNENRALGRV